MRKRRIIIAAITWCMAAVLMITLPGCNRNDAQMRIPENINELSLVQMWDDVVKIIGIQQQTAYLDEFLLDVSYQNGKINTLWFTCYVTNNRLDWTHYFIGFDEGRRLRWQSDETQGVPSEFNIRLIYNPRILFAELDKIGFSYVQSTSSGFSAHAQQTRNSTFSIDSPIAIPYHLKDGKLIPLKFITLNSEQLSMPVWIGRGQRQKPPAPPVPPDSEYVQLEIWFLSEDINKAEKVEYLESGGKAGYSAFVSGIQDVLPVGWELQVIDQTGIMDPPHGLNEPIFRIDFVDRTQQFKDSGGRVFNPSLRLYFYDIQEKDAILNVIEAEKIYSWDIPDYFDETSRYIIVTSPLYINGGVFTDQAMELYRPLETS
ncbi:MAG: hypothetical protein PHU23_09420, partial [Dehalococcoidales bacterium]|nr:hypothetical protein [Dehalococcoidales bacterium]